MGRDRNRLFESDNSQKERDQVMDSLVISLKKRAAAEAFIDAEDHDHKSMLSTPDMRAVLNSGIMDLLLAMYRDINGPLTELTLGAMMMEAGAKIRRKNMKRLRDLLPYVSFGTNTEAMPEDGFPNAGQAQYTAALDHYKAGTPRSFSEPSCDQCGKMECDVGHRLLEDICKETGIATSWWCNENCKAANKEDDSHAAE